jgi:hypothetical protein
MMLSTKATLVDQTALPYCFKSSGVGRRLKFDLTVTSGRDQSKIIPFMLWNLQWDIWDLPVGRK